MPIFRILVVDDNEQLRRVARTILQLRNDLQTVGEASDGLEAIHKAKILRPDLILLDIDLPKLNGIQAAKRLRDHVPRAKILFFSVESSSDVVREAFNVGGAGYIYKLNIGSELLPAIETVLNGKKFFGSGLEYEFGESAVAQARPRHHEVQFYSDDVVFLESVTHFVAAALKADNAAIVFATKPHRDSLLQALKAQGVDVDVAIQQGTYASLDAAETLSLFMVNGWPDPIRFFEGFSKLIESASKATKTQDRRIAIFGEGVALLWAERNTEAAIRLEQLGKDLAKSYNVDILCAYPLSLQIQEDERAFERICAEHSAVYSR
jgi:DNA-binding NarL/FixJ family response regulator